MEAVVEVFKTDVRDEMSAKEILNRLRSIFPDYKINFDLDDCDKILRVEGEILSPLVVAEVLKEAGFICEVLE